MTLSAAIDPGDVTAAVGAVLDEYEQCWSSLDFVRLRSLWDPDEADPIYVAEEGGAALIGYPAIEDYWSHTKAPLVRARLRTWDRRIKQVADDICVAYFAMRWMVELKPDGPMIVGASEPVDGRRLPVGGDVRVTAMFRHTAAGWRFIHYMEAPIGFLTQLAAMHESWVDDDFRAASGPTQRHTEKGTVDG